MPIHLILDNVRSLYNVGAILRVANGAGIEKVHLAGITGYPRIDHDLRKPWEIEEITHKISKTSLGAEKTISWQYWPDPNEAVRHLRSLSFRIVALEQYSQTTNLFNFKASEFTPFALIVGHERDGVNPELLNRADIVLEISMFGQKNSLNVATATAIAVYEFARQAYNQSNAG